MKHLDIFNLISGTEGLRPLGQWNHNLLATTYEWNRGLKERGEKEDGFEISVSKTFEVSATELYKYFADEKIRSGWLTEIGIKIRKATENKSMVITWKDGTTVRVELYNKSALKSQVVIRQMKIRDCYSAGKMKDYWKTKLGSLSEQLKN